MRPVRSYPKKKHPAEVIVPLILIMSVVTIIIGIVISISKPKKQIQDYFVQYENATVLVEVSYDAGTILESHTAVGFMNDIVYEQYKNGECNKSTIEIYHPYQKGKSVIVNTDSIIDIYKTSYEEFYRAHRP